MATYEVFDRDERTIRIEGELIGESSSADGNKARWIEIQIFITESGKYVVAGIGKSSNPGETDRPWVHVCTSPQGVVETLYLEDEDGVMYLTRVARTAIEQAARADEKLRDAYYTEKIS